MNSLGLLAEDGEKDPAERPNEDNFLSRKPAKG